MSMTISIDNLRKALRDTNQKAAVAFAEAEKRDPKGLYKKARAGQMIECFMLMPGFMIWVW